MDAVMFYLTMRLFHFSASQHERLVSDMERIRTLAAEEGALLADLEPLFLQAGPLDTLFEDHVHPNETGFELMAQGFFDVIAHGQTPSNFVPVGAGP